METKYPTKHFHNMLAKTIMCCVCVREKGKHRIWYTYLYNIYFV